MGIYPLSKRVVHAAAFAALLTTASVGLGWAQATTPATNETPAAIPQETAPATGQTGGDQAQTGTDPSGTGGATTGNAGATAGADTTGTAGSDATGAPPASTATDTTTPPTDAAATQPPASDGATADAAPAAYLTGSERLPPEVVDQWITAPKTVFDGNPLTSANHQTGSVGVPNYVRLLAGSDNRTVPLLVSLADSPDTTTDQVEAIARGLASAAHDAEKIAPLYSNYILVEVAKATSGNFKDRFQAALNQAAVSALGPGPAGAAGGSFSAGSVGGGGDAGPGQYQGGDAVTAQAGGNGGGGQRNVSASFSDLGGTSGNTIICITEDSRAGCQQD